MSFSRPTESEEFHRNRLRALRDRLDVIDAATALEDIALPHFDLHELKRDRAGTWAVKVNKNWRLTFTFADGEADNVNFEDYH